MVWFTSCSEDTPTSPANTDVGSTVIDPAAGGDVFLGSTTLSNKPGVRVGVWGENLTIDSDTEVSFDLVIVNKSDHPFHAQATFEIFDLEPEGVEALNAGASNGTTYRYNIAVLFGDDFVLSPGERSLPGRIKFKVPGLTSFSFGFNVYAETRKDLAISGTVFYDADQNGEFDPTMELGIKREGVWLNTTPTDDNPTGFVAFTRTDDNGAYAFWDLPAGVYTVRANGSGDWEHTTPNPLLVTLLEDADGDVVPIEGVDFGFFDPDPPNSLWLVDLEVDAGTEETKEFINPLSPANHRYVLHVWEPVYIRAPIGALYSVRAWINDTLAYEGECDDLFDEWMCFANGRHVDLPADFIGLGANHIRIAVEGWGEPFVFVGVERLLVE